MLDEFAQDLDDILAGKQPRKRKQPVVDDGRVQSILERMRGAASEQESGGNPNVRPNRRTGATGEFQVLPSNIPGWTRKYYNKRLSQQEFQNNPQAQRAVFDGEMGKYVRKALEKAKDEDTAIRMAAAMWYGGEGAINRYDNPKRFRADEPSFREYTTSVLSKTKGKIKSGFADFLKGLDAIVPAASEFETGLNNAVAPNPLDDFTKGLDAIIPTNQAQVLEIPQPVRESDFTIQEQIKSALDENSPRAAVLLTEPTQANIPVLADKNFTRVEIPNGSLFVNREKVKNLGLTTDALINNYVQKNGFVNLIGKVEDVGNQTADGMAVRTETQDGKELATSIVTNPAIAQQQADADKAQFGDKVNQQVIPTREAVQKRRIETLGGDTLDALSPVPQPQRTISDISDEETARFQPLEIRTTRKVRPGKAVTKNAITQNKGGYAEVSGAEVDKIAAELMQAPVAETSYREVPKDETNLQTVGKDIGKTVAAKVGIDLAQKPAHLSMNEYLSRAALQAVAPRFGLTQEQINNIIQKKGGDVLEYDAPDMTDEELKAYQDAHGDTIGYIRVNRGLINEALGGTNEQVNEAVQKDFDKEYAEFRNRQILANPVDQSFEIKEAEAKRLAANPLDKNNPTVRKQIADELRENSPLGFQEITEETIDAEIEKRQRQQLNEDEVKNSEFIGQVLNEVGKSVPSLLGGNSYIGTAIGGALGSGGRNIDWLAGLYKIANAINPASDLIQTGIGKVIGENTVQDEAAKASQAMRIIEAKSKEGKGFVGDVVSLAGGTVGDLPRLALQMSLPGGAVVGFALDHAISSVGRGETADRALVEALKGGVTGAIFKGAGVLGQSERRALSKILTEQELQSLESGTLSLSKKAEIVPYLYGRGVTISAITGGVTATGIAEGETPKDAFLSALQLAILDIGTNLKGDFKSLVGKVIKASDGKREVGAFIDENGKIITTKEVPREADIAIDLKPSEGKKIEQPVNNDMAVKLQKALEQEALEEDLLSNKETEQTSAVQPKKEAEIDLLSKEQKQESAQVKVATKPTQTLERHNIVDRLNTFARSSEILSTVKTTEKQIASKYIDTNDGDIARYIPTIQSEIRSIKKQLDGGGDKAIWQPKLDEMQTTLKFAETQAENLRHAVAVMGKADFVKLPDAEFKQLVPLLSNEFEFTDSKNKFLANPNDAQQREIAHQLLIKNQLLRGKNIPTEVLTDYPKLAKKYGKEVAEESQKTRIPANEVREGVRKQIDAKNLFEFSEIEVDGARRKSIGLKYQVQKRANGWVVFREQPRNLENQKEAVDNALYGAKFEKKPFKTFTSKENLINFVADIISPKSLPETAKDISAPVGGKFADVSTKTLEGRRARLQGKINKGIESNATNEQIEQWGKEWDDIDAVLQQRRKEGHEFVDKYLKEERQLKDLRAEAKKELEQPLTEQESRQVDVLVKALKTAAKRKEVLQSRSGFERQIQEMESLPIGKQNSTTWKNLNRKIRLIDEGFKRYEAEQEKLGLRRSEKETKQNEFTAIADKAIEALNRVAENVPKFDETARKNLQKEIADIMSYDETRFETASSNELARMAYRALSVESQKQIQQKPSEKTVQKDNEQAEQSSEVASEKESVSTPAFKVGDRVQDNLGRKGAVVKDRSGELYIEQERTKSHIPISDKWKKTSQQLKIDKQTARMEAKRAKLAAKGKIPVNELDKEFEDTKTGKSYDPIEEQSDAHYEALTSNKNVRMLISEAAQVGYEKGKVSSTDVIQAYEDVLNAVGKPTPIRTGRGNFAQKKARGFYDTKQEIIRLRTANNIPTAAHEIGHGLQKYIYGAVKASDLKALPIPVKRELVQLGKDLYGDRKPNGGYASEGFAEFMRLYLTTEDVARKAPNLLKWFEKEILSKNKKIADALQDARETTEIYRMEGAVNRAEANTAKTGTVKENIVRAKRALSQLPTQIIDEFTPLLRLSKDAGKIIGKELEPADDPFKVASFLRGNASATTHYFVFDGTMDFARNIVGEPLDAAASIVRGKKEAFSQYLIARRAQELLAEDINPGMTKEDADTLVKLYDRPKFQLAAEKVHKWQDDVLNYAREASPNLAPIIDKIFGKGWKNYVPLMREFDDIDLRAIKRVNQAGGNPLKRIQGSGRRIKDIFPQMIANAEKLIALANRQRVLDTIVKLSDVEGMGHIIEEVPVDKIPVSTEIAQIKKQLEDSGADLSKVDLDEVITFFSPAHQPKGLDPIVPMMKDGKMKWFQVDETLYNTLNGLDLYRLPKVLDLILGVPTRMFRLGTTGLRPAFSLVTNPTRDIQTFFMQSRESNPAKLVANYFTALAQALNPKRIVGKSNKDLDLFYRFGANLAQPLGADQAITRRTAKELFQGKVLRKVLHPIEMARELLSVSESVPRVAEIRNIAKEIGWDGKSPLTFEQAVQMGLGAKQVTVDFSATGSFGKKVNQAMPFFNANVQGTRLFAKQWRDRPMRTALYGSTMMLMPTLMLWWANKDKEWYKEMPSREKFLYWNIESGNNIIQIPRAFEYGNAFSVIPETLADAWYTEDPQGAKDAFAYILDTSTPPITPHTVQIAKEQWQNRIDFFDTPIVPKGEQDMLPGEQKSEGTTALASTLGEYFPNTVSPRRFEHLLRGLTGGVSIDVIRSVEQITGIKPGKEKEMADVFAIGKLYRRGGTVGYGSKTIDKFYDEYERLTKLSRSDDKEKKKEGAMFGEAQKVSKALKQLREMNLTDKSAESRNARTLLMREIAGKFLFAQAQRQKIETNAKIKSLREQLDLARKEKDSPKVKQLSQELSDAVKQLKP